ncbi:sulfatase family protein [Mucilaginibacter arboris]|uniref:Sulfatase-like hydrolase/transferase n=1 Tax=Mucilaginibacter arboris TaxID=2682090 RepID=A0A7K1ST43_9SPHI|nr:sulfatase [Mucilaginibacter arboris]MVN20471.1 sulfatase-like hydrolase/transferase [Mucilaginibacter arboris]
MKLRNISAIIFTLTVIVTIAAFVNPKKKKVVAEKKHPNILIILVDQFRGQALGFEGKEPVITPNLDLLAKNSYVGLQMIANYPVCSPSRAMLMTGKYPLKNHVYGNVNSNTAPYGVELPAGITCWSDVLKANGYDNGYIGKWHLDSPHKPYIPTYNNEGAVAWNEWTPPDRRHGFDYWYAYGTYDHHLKPMYWDTKASRDNFHYENEWGPQHEATKALEFLRNDNNSYRDKNKPFALVVSMNPPHSDYESVPQEYVDLYKNVPMATLLKDPNIPPAGTPMGDEYRKNVKYYYACITGVDTQAGRILNYLKQSKLDDNTIVIFMADHGNCLGKHDEISKNNIYEESLRIPFIVQWKGHIKPKMDNVALMNVPDIYPTLLGLAGLNNKIPGDLDGSSMASYITNGQGKLGNEQYLLGAVVPPNTNTGFRGIRTLKYKLAYVRKNKVLTSYLFDLKNDPFELNNIYAENDSIVKRLRPSLQEWLKKTNDKFLLP